MVLKENHLRLRILLAQAIPMLCRSGLDIAESEFSVEALIGITLGDGSETLLVNFKETVTTDGNTVAHVWADLSKSARQKKAEDNGDRTLNNVTFDDSENKSSVENRLATGRSRAATKEPNASLDLEMYNADGDDIQDEFKIIDCQSNESNISTQTFPTKRPISRINSVASGDVSSCSPSTHNKKRKRPLEVEPSSSRSGNTTGVKTEHVPVKYEPQEEDVRVIEMKNNVIKIEDDDEEGEDGSGGGAYDPAYLDTADWNSTDYGSYNQEGQVDDDAYDDTQSSYAESYPAETTPQRHRWSNQRVSKSAKRGRWPAVGAGVSSQNSMRTRNPGKFDSESIQSGGPDGLTDLSTLAGNESQANYQTMMEDMCSSIMQQSRVLSAETFICHICQARLGSAPTLKAHIKGSHLELKSYRCDLCPEAFKWFMQLHRHRKRYHPDQFPMTATPGGVSGDPNGGDGYHGEYEDGSEENGYKHM